MSAGGKRTGAGRKPGSPNKVTAEIRELAQPYAAAALKELARIASRSSSDTARVAAIKEILDRAYGKPSQSISADVQNRVVNFVVERVVR